MTTPASLKYSEAFKPVSVPSQVATAKFLPTTSQPYNASNNVVRIPLNSNSFLDLRNLALKFAIKNNATGKAVFLDGNAGSVISQMNIIGPDGAYLSQVQNYNRLYNGLCDIEKSLDVHRSVYNLLEGASNDAPTITVKTNAVGGEFEVYVNGVQVGDTLATGTARTARAGEYLFATTAVANVITVKYRGETAETFTTGTAKKVQLGNNTFASNGTAGQFIVNETTLVSGTANVALLNDPREVKNAFITSEVIANNGKTTYCVNLASPLTRLSVLYPAGHVGGGGAVIELFLAPADQVFYSSTTGTAPIYEATDFEAIVPVINYPESVNMAFKNMLQQMGSITMSSVDYQSFVIPHGANVGTISAPLAFRYRSLKNILFMFSPTQSASDYSIPRVSAREFPASNTSASTLQFQLRVGSSLFPRQPVSVSNYVAGGVPTQNMAEAMTELQKSISKFGSIVHGSVLSKDNYAIDASAGGKFICGLDLESDQSFIEAGLNTQENGLSAILEINGMDACPAGNIYVFAMYDCSISLLANGNLVATR